MSEAAGSALKECIDRIEAAYEFMLSYAARGRRGDNPDDPEGNVRPFLQNAVAALDRLSAAADAQAKAVGLEDAVWRPYREILAADAQRARAALALVLAQPSIGSDLIDNLNASMHVRTLVTDLFLIDGVFDAAAKA